MFSRRDFLKAAAVLSLTPNLLIAKPNRKFFKIALSEYSFQRSLKKGLFTHLDFPAKAAALEIDAVDLASPFFKGKENDANYIQDLLTRLKDASINPQSLLIDEGSIGATSPQERKKFTANIQRWMDIAKKLECKSVTVNYTSKSATFPESKLVAENLSALSDFAVPLEMNVLIRNNSLAPAAVKTLADVFLSIKKVNSGMYSDISRIGTSSKVDRYNNITIVSPFTKVFCANSMDFNVDGIETITDYYKMLDLIDAALYKDYITIQYEGKNLGEEDGIKATKSLLLAMADKLKDN